MSRFLRTGIALSLLSLASAQYTGYNGGGYGNNGIYNGPGSVQNEAAFQRFIAGKHSIVIAHGVLAALAFVIFFPTGAILIRLGSFRGSWLVHALIQATGYVIFIAGAGLGIYIARNIGVLNQAHPIIGLILLGLLFFQALLGATHHFLFKKYNRRMFWSHAHIWLGRAGITLGIINGGLGLQLAQRLRIFAPTNGEIVAYSVVAGVIWLVYIACAIVGEVRRSSSSKQRNGPQKQVASDADSAAAVPSSAQAGQPVTSNGVHEHYGRDKVGGETYA